MKRLLLILILTLSFQSLTKAEDVKDFEIEGISIGDSALAFFSKEEIKNNISIPPNLKKSKYTQSCFNKYGDTYDRICIAYNKNNSKKIIEQIQAQIRYNKDAMNTCRKKQNKIDKELSLLFKNLERIDWGKSVLTSLKDKDPEAHYYPITYEFVDKSRAQLGCYSIFSKTSLKIGVYTRKFGLVISK
jgi:hypothetical protein